MGQEQSTPSGDKFQPDFMTAHVKGVSKELAPQKKPFQGHSAVGADSLMMAAARKAQENVSGDSYSRPYQGLPSSMGADSYLLQEMKKVSTSNATTEEEDYKPSVGADSWLMTRQKKYATGQDNHVRNRFNLMDNHLAKGVDNTNYEMDFAASAKKVTKGAVRARDTTETEAREATAHSRHCAVRCVLRIARLTLYRVCRASCRGSKTGWAPLRR